MALTVFIRASDLQRLISDTNVEVKYLLYPPHANNVDELGVGDGDPARPGAVMTVVDSGKTKLAIYQGSGIWLLVGTATQSMLSISSDTTISWQSDIAPDESGNPSGQTYAQRFGNTPNIQVWMDTGSGYSLETVPVMMTFSGTNIDTITIQVGSINSRVIIK